MPKTRQEYWEPKLSRNVERDKEAEDKLKKGGWRVIIVWECEIEKTPDAALEIITKRLNKRGAGN